MRSKPLRFLSDTGSAAVLSSHLSYWDNNVNTISKYIFKDILKTQGAIFGVLMLIFMSQTFIKFIGRASKGNIPAELVSQLLALSVPTMANFMLPLSLFLAVLFSIGSFCSQSEMVVMRSVGYSHRRLLGVITLLIIVNMAVNVACTCFLSPWCESRQLDLINKAKSKTIAYHYEDLYN